MSPADVVAAVLTTGSGAPCSVPGLGMPWPVYIAWTPDDAIVGTGIVVVYPTGGVHWPRSLDLGEELDMMSVQVAIIGPDYATTWAQAESVARWLEELRDMPVGTVVARAFRRSSTLTFVGYDAQRRVTVTLNGYILYE